MLILNGMVRQYLKLVDYLNTSYVDIKQVYLFQFHVLFLNLNTSYVDIKPFTCFIITF